LALGNPLEFAEAWLAAAGNGGRDPTDRVPPGRPNAAVPASNTAPAAMSFQWVVTIMDVSFFGVCPAETGHSLPRGNEGGSC
jgi:hypothetical protein